MNIESTHCLILATNPGRWSFIDWSTAINLMVLQNFVINAFGQSKKIDEINLDFSKIFDWLVDKIGVYRIQGVLLKWLNSYLTKRHMMVRFTSGTFTPFVVTFGVPQGILVPMLFNGFLNNIVSSTWQIACYLLIILSFTMP